MDELLTWETCKIHDFGGDEIEKIKILYYNNIKKFKKLFSLEDLYKQFNDHIENTWYRKLYCFYTFVFRKYFELLVIEDNTNKLLNDLFNSDDEDNIIIACNMLMKLKLKDNVGKL